ncbi:MAG: 3-dehydroquinate synthase [Bdellovibrionales bacterium]|jgi:3-dehydroquinate synthase
MNHALVPIALKTPDRAYNILIGENLIAQAGTLIAQELGRKRLLIVTDANVASFYLAPLEATLKEAGHTVLPSIVLPAGEKIKSFDFLQKLMAQLFDRAMDRGVTLIALGGGVIGDLTGFAASITLRGIDFIQIPTTLLAQVDSSVGGKTGINSAFGKNTVGTFYQPRLVLADSKALDTLPRRQLLAGYAEVVKYGLIQDAAFFAWCQQNVHDLLQGEGEARVTAIQKSCAYKAAIVAQDEREAGSRALLNLGHTFGHALEAAAGYDNNTLLHGEAVAIGTVMAFMLSASMGLFPAADAQAVREHFVQAGLPTAPAAQPYDIDQLMAYMAQDKKAKEGRLTLILTRGIGKAFVAADVDPATVRALWAQVTKA